MSSLVWYELFDDDGWDAVPPLPHPVCAYLSVYLSMYLSIYLSLSLSRHALKKTIVIDRRRRAPPRTPSGVHLST